MAKNFALGFLVAAVLALAIAIGVLAFAGPDRGADRDCVGIYTCLGQT